MGQYQAAIDYLTPMARSYPEETEIKLQLAFAQLGAGHYGAAFRTYDARWDSDELGAPNVPFPNVADRKHASRLPESIKARAIGDLMLSKPSSILASYSPTI